MQKFKDRRLLLVSIAACSVALLVSGCNAPSNGSSTVSEYKVIPAPCIVRNKESGPTELEILAQLESQLNTFAREGWEPVSAQIDSSRRFPPLEGLSRGEIIDAAAGSSDWAYSLQSGDSGMLILRRVR